MEHAIAVINPSRFEGWSTTVEEAKSMGKRVILSDIPVHREQAPARATYCPTDDPKGMADALVTAVDSWLPGSERLWLQAAAAELPGRIESFDRTYQDIVLETPYPKGLGGRN